MLSLIHRFLFIYTSVVTYSYLDQRVFHTTEKTNKFYQEVSVDISFSSKESASEPVEKIPKDSTLHTTNFEVPNPNKFSIKGDLIVA
jgi:hypothetical protein